MQGIPLKQCSFSYHCESSLLPPAAVTPAGSGGAFFGRDTGPWGAESEQTPSSLLVQPLCISQELSPSWGLSRWPWRSKKLTVIWCREVACWNHR